MTDTFLLPRIIGTLQSAGNAKVTVTGLSTLFCRGLSSSRPKAPRKGPHPAFPVFHNRQATCKAAAKPIMLIKIIIATANIDSTVKIFLWACFIATYSNPINDDT